MRTRMTITVVVTLCALAVFASAQTQPAGNLCNPSPIGTGVCPPTGTNMGQSDYQRATHGGQGPSSITISEPIPTTTTQPMTPPISEPPIELPTPNAATSITGAGAELYETTPMPTSIAVDSDFVYVLRGNDVVKLTKHDMKVVSTTELPAASAP